MNPARLAAGAAVFLLVVGVLAYQGARALPGEVEREQKQVCMPLEPDPTWQIQPAKEFTLKDIKGRPASLSMYRGRVVFLNFWATWCPPCRDEMDSLDRLARSFSNRKDFVMLLVSEDKTWSDVLSFFSTPPPTNMTFLMDEDFRVGHSYGTEKLPETYLIDKDGNVRQYIINKRQWDTPQAFACVQSLLD